MTGAASTVETTREQALTRLLASMHEAGIVQTDPNGVLLMQLFESTTAASTNMVNAQVTMWETMARLESEIARVRADLASGRTGIEQLKLAGEQKIKAWETIAERERLAAINKVIQGIVVDLKPKVIATLVELLPAAERDFLASARYQLWGWIAASSAAVLLIGFFAGLGWSWKNIELAKYCEAHQVRDAKGIHWCPVPEWKARGGKS